MKDTIEIDGDTYYTNYEVPKAESVIWRFLDLAKFISLLKGDYTRADQSRPEEDCYGKH